MFQKKFLSLLTAVSLTVASFSGGITAPVAAEASSTETIVLTKEDCMTYDVFMSSLKKEGLSGWHRSVYGEGECDAGGIGITYASKRKKVVDDAQEDKYHYEYNEVNDYFCFSPTYFSDHEIYYYKLDHFLTENDKLTIRFYINDDFYKLDLEGKTLSTWKELYEAEGYSTDEMPILSNPSYIFHVPMELETPQDRKGSSTEDHPATEAPGSRTITIKKEDCISEDAFRSYLEKEGLSSSSYWENSNAKVENVKRYERVYVASTGQYSYEEIYVDDYLCLSGGDGENYYYKLDEIKEGSQLIVNYSIGDDVYKNTMERISADDLNRYYNGLDENSNGDYKYFSETSHVFHYIVSVESLETGTSAGTDSEMEKAVKKLVVHKPVKIPNVTLPKLKKEKLSDDIIVGKKGKDLPDIGWVCNIIIKKGSLKEAAKLHKYLKKYKGKKYKGKYPSYQVHLKIKASNMSQAMKKMDKLQKNLGYVNKYGIQVLAEDDSDHYYCMKKGKYFITNYDW
ncbi:MAG: hypothetical protein IJ733_20350, partial [Lachnospiraceae bacterium]|nr:hypothetical protein [Lachnospiraceae bacterium]